MHNNNQLWVDVDIHAPGRLGDREHIEHPQHQQQPTLGNTGVKNTPSLQYIQFTGEEPSTHNQRQRPAYPQSKAHERHTTSASPKYLTADCFSRLNKVGKLANQLVHTIPTAYLHRRHHTVDIQTDTYPRTLFGVYSSSKLKVTGDCPPNPAACQWCSPHSQCESSRCTSTQQHAHHQIAPIPLPNTKSAPVCHKHVLYTGVNADNVPNTAVHVTVSMNTCVM